MLVVRLRKLLGEDHSASSGTARVDEAQRNYLIGRLELLEQNYESAEAAFARAVAADPSTTEYRYQWAQSLARNGKHDIALSQINLCLLQEPENARYRSLRDAWTRTAPADRDSGREHDQRGKKAGRGG